MQECLFFSAKYSKTPPHFGEISLSGMMNRPLPVKILNQALAPQLREVNLDYKDLFD